ncbi:MAG: hypothetical protein Q9221_009185 [Calogaya cf. arnoldii]
MELPREIVLQVIEQVHPNDLDNIFLSCRTLFEFAKQVRKRHLEKKERYRTVILGDVHFTTYRQFHDPNDKDNIVHPAFALRDLLHDREAMSDYCHTLRVGGLDADGQLRNKMTVVITKNTVLAGHGPKFPPSSVHHLNMSSQCQELADGNYGLPYFMMFAFLEQVQVIELVRLGNFFDNDNLGTWNLLLETDEDTTFTPPMGQLQDLRIIGDQYEYGEDLDKYSVFLKIPHLRTSYGYHVIAVGDELKYLNTCWPILEELHFHAGAVDSGPMEYLLCGTNRLETFYYEKDYSDDRPWAPWQFISSLRKYALETLENLTLLDCPGLGTDEGERPEETTLRDFKTLKHAAIEFSLFVIPYRKATAEHQHHRKYESNDRVSKLVDVLPPSLETLVLHAPGTVDDLAAMFRDLPVLHTERLPSLWSITVKMERSFKVSRGLKGIKKVCQQFGINFEVQTGQTK